MSNDIKTVLPPPRTRIDTFGDVTPMTGNSKFIMGDFYDAEQMRAAIEAAVLAASAPALVKPKPPKWYDREEMVMLLRHMNYCDVIAQELADWMVRHLQFAFNKGFQVRGWDEYTKCKPASPVDAQDAADANDEQNLQIGRAVNRAAGTLPEGWQMTINIEQGYGGVEICDPEGSVIELNFDGEPFSVQINGTTDYAIDAALQASQSPQDQEQK